MVVTAILGNSEHWFLVSSVTFIMALLVAQARIETGVHSFTEVAFGGILGALVALVVFQVLAERVEPWRLRTMLRRAPMRRTPSSSWGAVARARDGRLFTGVNVENAAYPLGICARSGAASGLLRRPG